VRLEIKNQWSECARDVAETLSPVAAFHAAATSTLCDVKRYAIRQPSGWVRYFSMPGTGAGYITCVECVCLSVCLHVCLLACPRNLTRSLLNATQRHHEDKFDPQVTVSSPNFIFKGWDIGAPKIRIRVCRYPTHFARLRRCFDGSIQAPVCATESTDVMQ